MKNKKIGLGIIGVVVLVGVFYGGMTYGGNNVRAAMESRVAAFGQNGGFGARGTRGVGGGTGGFTSGKIISKDATSITIQLMTGGAGGTASGSKIVFLDSNTKVSKQATGTLADLSVGTEVSITGTPNADGSVSATAVQIRPVTPPVLK